MSSTMIVLREVQGFVLNEGSLMAAGLFNITAPNGDVSNWFDSEMKDELINCDDSTFISVAIEILDDEANY